jgi:hypothetical protein
MRFKSYRLGCLLACGISSLIAMGYGKAAFANPVIGTENIYLSHVFAVLKTGQSDPNDDDTGACSRQMATPGSQFLASLVTTRYIIDAKSQTMSAFSILLSQRPTPPFVVKVPLAALDLGNQHAFGAFRPAELPDAYVLFSVGPDFKAATSAVLVLNPDKHYNCLVTNDPTPFNSALSTKFGAHQ